MKVTVVIRCARTYGLLEPLRSMLFQDFDADDYEIVLVDWLYEERKELLDNWWNEQCFTTKPTLVHVPPLPPLAVRDNSYHAWDICLSFNTGLAYAKGEVVMHLEDHWVVRNNWISTFYELVSNNPQYVVFGDKLAEPLLDDSASGHYGLPRNPNPDQPLTPLSLDGYGGAVFVNFAHVLAPFVKVSFPEWPSRFPETFWGDQLARCNLGYATTPLAPAWHKAHPPGGGIVGWVSQMTGGLLEYRQKMGADRGASSAYDDALQRPSELNLYRRDLESERKRLGR